MTLKSALQDLKETTLVAVSGLFGRLSYLSSLRNAYGRYRHWGLEAVHGAQSSERALKTAHVEVVTGILRAPLETLVHDLGESSSSSGVVPAEYVGNLQDKFDDLLPAGRADSPAATHLSSVLSALSHLEKNR